MHMPFLTNSETDIREMLAVIGVNRFDELISNIPDEIRFKKNLNIPAAISEAEVSDLLNSLAEKNKRGVSFMGGGAYDHYIPAIVGSLISRSEFYTAYTPYQPEVSQGTLQAIYEFQSMICELSGMDVTNASMYEGGSALAEAMLLACNHTQKKRILIAGTLNPRYRQVLRTYVNHNDIDIEEVPSADFVIDPAKIKKMIGDDHAALIIQHPNYFGFLEDVWQLAEMVKEKKALFISFYDPISLGLLAPPGAYGADIAVAEGQVLGNHQNFGGPYLGLFSTGAELVRKIPGRIVGKTTDIEGKPGYVLTLQTREQHIRREKATSNICTNSGLLALAATIYLAALGKKGIKDVANLCLQKSHYLAQGMQEIDGVKLASPAPFFKEFTIKVSGDARGLLQELARRNILGGISLAKAGYPDHLLVAVTEKRTKKELDLYLDELRKIIDLKNG
jgi:glycine dehydrogenase subunit 1